MTYLSQALETSASQGLGQGGRLARAWLTGGPPLPTPPLSSRCILGWASPVCQTLFSVLGTRGGQDRLDPTPPGASRPSGRGEPYTSAQASKIWMLDVPGGDFPSGTVDENPLASAGNVGSIPVLGQSHMLQSN